MKQFAKSTLAVLLALVMLAGTCQPGIAFAIDEADKALNPAEHIELTVPEKFRDGGSWFFIAQAEYAAGERSGRKIYIPIQRTGDLDSEAQVVLKVSDLTARHDVNYTVEIYKEKLAPDIIFGDISVKDIALNADSQEEVLPAADENELGELIYEAGGADLVDGQGNVVAEITAVPEGRESTGAESTREEPKEESASQAPASDSESEPLSRADLLRQARETFTGTVSDRQELPGGDFTGLFAPQDPNAMTEDEYNKAMADALVEDYPGKEYLLSFAPGEEAKFLVITPKYSPEAEGDAQIMVMLKDPSEGYGIGEDTNPVSVTIYDEDEPEPVYVSMADETVVAKNGKATVTVTRTGRLNAIKGVRLQSWGGSAVEGDEYSGVGATLYFPVGIQSRSVDIPVFHGQEEKDFYLSITALTDEKVERKTVHVIIPSRLAEGSLMDANDAYSRVWSRKVTGPINLKDGYFEGQGGFDSDTSIWLSTPSNQQGYMSKYFYPAKDLGYAYDGVYTEFSTYLNYCDADSWLSFWDGSNGTCVHINSFDDGGIHNNGHWLSNNWGSPKAPDKFSLETKNTDNEGTKWNDSYVSTWFHAVYLIKRQFTVTLEDPEVKPLIGLPDSFVKDYYETVSMDNSDSNTRTLWTDEAFAVTATVKQGPLRLVGLEAKTQDGRWFRIVTVNGTSQTANLTMNADNINTLAAMNAITWQKVTMSGWKDSYKGKITVRPVFDYINTTVELADDQYGNLKVQAPNPTLLWDFGTDGNMSGKLGVNWREHQVSWTESNKEFRTFTASGDDPYVSVETPVADASTVLWVKIRAKTSGSGSRMQLFASAGNAGRSLGNTCFNIPITNDGQWHEYVVNITNANWKGVLRWLRLDPTDGCRSGDTVDIDYIAFFETEASARAFRSGDGFTSTPGIYTYHLGDVVTFSTVSSEKGKAENMLPDGFYYARRKGGPDGEFVNSTREHYMRNDNPYEGYLAYELDGKGTAGNKTTGGEIIDDMYYRFEPRFTELHNSITVLVSENYYNRYLDTSKGLFAAGNYVSIEHDEPNRRYVIVVDTDILTNDIYELTAYTKAPDSVIAKWITSDGREFFGDTFYVLSSPRIEDNVVTLEAASGSHLTYVTLTGTVVTPTFNLAAQRSATDANPVQNALVSYGSAAAWTDENGSFTLPGAIYYDSDALIRYTVTFNGLTTIQEAKVPSRNAAKHDAVTLSGRTVKAVTANAGTVKVANYTNKTAHVDHIEVKQDGIITGYSTGMPMNGQRLTVNAYIAQGQDYAMNGETYSEHITDVTAYFVNQTTGEVHGVFSSNVPASQQGSAAKWSYDAKKGLFTLRITSFDPDHPTEWTYGDVLMIRITSDRKSGVSAMAENQNQKQIYDAEQKKYVAVDLDDSDKIPMVYVPVSSGLAVIADPDYKPRTFNYSVDNFPELLKIEPPTDEDGKLMDDDTRYSFGSFPYIGEITATLHVFTKVISSPFLSVEAQMIQNDLNEMAGDAVTPGISGEGYSKQDTAFGLSAFFNITETMNGDVRFMLGVVMSYGGGKGYESQKNPYRSARDLIGGLSIYSEALKIERDSDLIRTPVSTVKRSDFGGAYFKVSTFLGLYLDYGYVCISKDGGKEVSHDMVFMGAGGFIGFNVSAGYTYPFFFILGVLPVPAYLNVEAGIKGTLFLGSEGNHQKTLASFYTEPEMKGQDFSFNFEFQGRIYATGTVGVGIYKVVGARVSVGVGFEFGYSNNVTKWWPRLFDTGWGYTMEATFAGTLDLIFTSIDVYSASWPMPIAEGFIYYFQEVKRANKCILYVENGLNDEDCDASASEKSTARQMVDELKKMVDANALSGAAEGKNDQLYDTKAIKNKTFKLMNYAYEHDIISWVVRNTIEMNKQGGITGSAINAIIEDENGVSLGYHTNDHVNSRWVAGNGQLQAAYSVVNSVKIMEDAYAQPSSKILPIGGGRYLMVFLDDTVSRDRIQAATLKWTVYDARDDSWTEPQTVQNDLTADSRPHLADAGDKVVLTWASSTDAKYANLKSDIASELAAAELSSTDVDVQEALEADPTRAMSIMDIFAVEFDKASGTFGTITQLTDDGDYDDYPQAVYDSSTKDYIVIYYKTAVDDDESISAAEKLMNMVAAGPDPAKTYSVVAYMLYNGTEKDDRGTTVPVGWMTNHMFYNELPYKTDENGQYVKDESGKYVKWSSDEFIAKYGPERFLPSTILTADGTYADPPINDLTVAPGYNGLAAYAFTVDKDFNLNTAQDRELYVQFYDFARHSTYVPIKVGGTTTAYDVEYDNEADDFVQYSYTKEVEVGTPRLIRNGGSTYLFWREEGNSLRYLNISKMLNDKVATKADPGEDDWTWAVRSNGTFATDAVNGPYEPNVMKVDFGSALTADEIEITDYEVLSDEEENLYVVWTDAVTHNVTNEIGETYPVTAQEIYASAMIHQGEKTVTVKDEEGGETTGTTETVRWSKPYRLTRDNTFNDGLALALDPDGSLLIVHNQYSKLTAQSEEELIRLITEKKIGVTEDKEGNLYAPTLSYNSPVSLMVTRLEKVGSIETTIMDFSDQYPVAGQTVTVTAVLENVGLTNAEGFEAKFYEYKDGKRGALIATRTSDDEFVVNTAKSVTFNWDVPADGPEGYQIEAAVREKNGSGSYYDPVSTFSSVFAAAPSYSVEATEAFQEGDQFRIRFTAANEGNQNAPEGTSVSIRLVGLHGDLDSERYGNIKDAELYNADLTSDLTAKTLRERADMDAVAFADPAEYQGDILVDIPASLFDYCGYDAVQAVITDADGNVLAESDQCFVAMDQPMNLTLNGGEDITLKEGGRKTVTLDFDTTVFIDDGTVVYSVDDASVASVSPEGVVTGLEAGTATLTATLLPSGRTASVKLTVNEAEGPELELDTTDLRLTLDSTGKIGYTASENAAVTFASSDESVVTVDESGTVTAVSEGTATVTVTAADEATGRTAAKTCTVTVKGNKLDIIVIFDDPEPEKPGYETCERDEECPMSVFEDLNLKAWYHDGVHWALENGVMAGYGNGRFVPNGATSRAMIVTMLHRMEGGPIVVSDMDFADVEEGKWYTEPIRWAAANGIVSGYGKGKFGPNDELTREQLATILYRYAKTKGKGFTGLWAFRLKYEDAADVSDWAYEALCWMTMNGIIQGLDDGLLHPKGSATRAQVATMLMRYEALMKK